MTYHAGTGRLSDRRHLDWKGCFNVRDLGGLPTTDGRRTRWGAVVRSDALDGLTAAGWTALIEHGVRTIIDLRNDDERGPDASPRPTRVITRHLPLDGTEDRAFWNAWDTGPQFGTPLYYRPHLERFPNRSAAVIAAVAHAEPGAVVFHCAGGRDRAGQIAMLLLALVGVAPDNIAEDYELSHERLGTRCAAHGEENLGPLLKAFLADEGTTAGEVIIATLARVDVDAQLRAGGLTDRNLATLRRRLLSPPAPAGEHPPPG